MSRDELAYPVELPLALQALLNGGAGRILAIHRPEDARTTPAMNYVRSIVAGSGHDFQELNQAYESMDLPDRLAMRNEPGSTLPRVFGDMRPRVVFLTGWGSDPRAADRLLKAVYDQMSRRPSLRLIVLNNATAPIYVQSNVAAHPDATGFGEHLTKLLGIAPEMIEIVELAT